MQNFIKHTRAWTAALIAFPFVLLVYVVSLTSLLVFALAMALIKIPQLIYATVGPHIARSDGKKYKNWLVRFSQRMADAADWPNR